MKRFTRDTPKPSVDAIEVRLQNAFDSREIIFPSQVFELDMTEISSNELAGKLIDIPHAEINYLTCMVAQEIYGKNTKGLFTHWHSESGHEESDKYELTPAIMVQATKEELRRGYKELIQYNGNEQQFIGKTLDKAAYKIALSLDPSLRRERDR